MCAEDYLFSNPTERSSKHNFNNSSPSFLGLSTLGMIVVSVVLLKVRIWGWVQIGHIRILPRKSIKCGGGDEEEEEVMVGWQLEKSNKQLHP